MSSFIFRSQIPEYKKITNYIFTDDSLSGFDEQAARISAFAEGCFGEEFKMKMYRIKRQFVKNKFLLNGNDIPANYSNGNNKSLVANCTNEDFESSAPGVVTTSNQVLGWTITCDYNYNYTDNCSLQLCCQTNTFADARLIQVPPGGYIDTLIGYNYPIFSVFGSTPNSGNIYNPYLPPMKGNKILRLNLANQFGESLMPDYAQWSVAKLSKVINVTPSNSLFEFAFIAEFESAHLCCTGPAFFLKLTNLNTNTTLNCPYYSVNSPSGGFCNVNPSNFSVDYYRDSCFNPAINAVPPWPITCGMFNKWKVESADLSPYIGQSILVEAFVADCIYGGHYGYLYFDAQCAAMPMPNPSMTVPTCGAPNTTVTAPIGFGPYSWSSNQITIPPNLTSPSFTNNALVTNQSGTVQLTMTLPGGCNPFTRTVNILVTPAPIITASVTQSSCINTVSSVSITPAGSASLNPIITWSPSPGALSGNSLVATSLSPGITTITVQDQAGCVAITTVSIVPPPPQVTFSLISASPSLTCIHPSVNLTALTNYTFGALSYTWVSQSFTAGTNSISINQPNSFTVTVSDPITGCSDQKTISIGVNTIAPQNAVNPINQVITCTSNAAITFTGTVLSPTANIQNNWYSPLNPLPNGVPIASSAGTISLLTGNIPPGVYTLQTTDLVNGCKTSKTVSVTSLDAWPVYSIGSSTSFSVGCVPLNQSTLSIINPVSTQTPPATCSYTFLAPGFGGSVSPGILGNSTSTLVQIPGSWTVIVQDNSNNCRTQLVVPILQNTLSPDISANLATQTLNCYNPTVLATGTSSTINTMVEWLLPVNPPLLSSSTLVIGDPQNGPNTSSTTLTYAVYTVVVTNTLNACTSSSVINIYQNFKPPVSSPTISVGTPTAIYCTASSNPVVLTTGNSTITSGGGPTAFPIPYLWEGPSPQPTMTGNSSYSCYVAGVYSLTIMDNFNGCIKTSTINVIDKTQPPVISAPASQATIECGSDYATLNFLLMGDASGMLYQITTFPEGTAFSNQNILSGSLTNSINVSQPGYYGFAVTNTLTGCSAMGNYTVVNGSLSADFSPDPVNGYPPLLVTFTNLSSGGNGSQAIWNFGNGTSQTTIGNASVATVYSAAGTYSVTLIETKGPCLDTAIKVIHVGLSSDLLVPNVFTPNGDGTNDFFILNTAGIGKIDAKIFDRWGNCVYEVNSFSGNILWDGKNKDGNNCSEGIYFYIISAIGDDEKNFSLKGNISLFR